MIDDLDEDATPEAMERPPGFTVGSNGSAEVCAQMISDLRYTAALGKNAEKVLGSLEERGFYGAKFPYISRQNGHRYEATLPRRVEPASEDLPDYGSMRLVLGHVKRAEFAGHDVEIVSADFVCDTVIQTQGLSSTAYRREVREHHGILKIRVSKGSVAAYTEYASQSWRLKKRPGPVDLEELQSLFADMAGKVARSTIVAESVKGERLEKSYKTYRMLELAQESLVEDGHLARLFEGLRDAAVAASVLGG